MKVRFALMGTLGMLLAATLSSTAPAGAAEALLRPYVLAGESAAPLQERLDAVKTALQGAGFELAGELRLGEDAAVLVVTSEALKKAAAATDLGGYGAAQRVSVTRVGDKVQVAYTNPAWMANVYRMEGELADVSAALGRALGGGTEFGSKSGLTAAQLRSYHYMVTMPYFTDQEVLARHGSHAQALERVEAGLAKEKGVRRICRIDIPGKEQSLFCVALLEGPGSDATVMKVTDKAPLRHTAHLPYEFLVDKNRVLMLPGKFRIAQSFPDLTMGTFMKISAAPAAIEKAIKAAVR